MNGKWRQIEGPRDYDNEQLPGKSGTLKVATGDFIAVQFETSDSTMWFQPESVEVDDRGYVVCESGSAWGMRSRHVFAPASSVKRKKLPVPERPSLRYFGRATDWKNENATMEIHRVMVVEKWPDPNRAFNAEDALVRSACTVDGWVQPQHMEPEGVLARCLVCYPPDAT